MSKKYILLTGATLLMAGSALAATNCDSQAKPALSCPTGYSMMCSPVGGDHWGCARILAGAIVETPGIKVEATTEVKTQESSSSALQVEALETKTSVDGDVSTERLLPTVNKKTGAKVTVMGWDATTKKGIQERVDAVVEEDSAIRSAEVSEDSVSMTYQTQAKLFGFISVPMNIDISSNTEGQVKVHFPWYRFLVKTEFDNVAEILNGIFQHNESDWEFVRAKGSASAQIQIFRSLSASMHEMAKPIIQNIK